MTATNWLRSPPTNTLPNKTSPTNKWARSTEKSRRRYPNLIANTAYKLSAMACLWRITYPVTSQNATVRKPCGARSIITDGLGWTTHHAPSTSHTVFTTVTSVYGPHTVGITTTKKAFGNGKGPIFLAPQKTCSLKPSWCHSSSPCSRMQELWCSLHVNATGKPMSISSTTMVASTPLTANTRNMLKAEVG